MRCGGSESAEDIGPPQSFFPRCFDLSDSSQLDEFKDNFRQTAAAVVLKVGGHARSVVYVNAVTTRGHKEHGLFGGGSLLIYVWYTVGLSYMHGSNIAL